MTADIEISTEGGVQVLRLARAGKKNALTQDMYRALSNAIEAGDQSSDIAAHVLFGSGGIFSAGNDINDFLATSQGTGGPGPDVLRFIRLLPVIKKPMISGVDGAAVGIGTTLLLHCDLVYASPASSFSTPFLDLGLVPEAASSLLAPQRMGHARAFEMLVLGQTFTAERAREAGIVNAVVAAHQLEATALDAARKLAAKPPAALALARQLLRGDPKAVLTRTDEEADLFKRCLTSPEAREAFAAFLSKRPADFLKFRAKT